MDTETPRATGAHAPSTAEVIEGLNDLLRLDHDAVGAYRIAIEKLEDRDHADQIAGFLREHERHIRELNELIAALGGTPVNEPHATGPFKEALQSLGGLAGDKGVLLAWRANELQVRTKYDSYAAKAVFWPNEVKRLIDRNALDEERHYQWVVDVLQRMGVGAGDELETGLATRLREGGVRAEAAMERVRERADELASSARNRIAAGLDAAADRLEESPAAAGRAAPVTHRLAGGMHGGAEYLRDADLERVRTDLERSVQHYPLRTLAVLFAAGFVIGRLLR